MMKTYYCLYVLVLIGLYGVSGAPLYAQNPELPLGSTVPSANATFQNVNSGNAASLASLMGQRGTVVIFWSNQCAWVDKYEERVLQLVQEFGGQGIAFVLVNANDAAAFPKENAEESQSRAQSRSYPAYLMDANGQLAGAFGASRTPHVFAFDANRVLIYSGTIDDSPGDPGSVQNEYLRNVLSALASGGSVEVPKTKAFGCTIKS